VALLCAAVGLSLVAGCAVPGAVAGEADSTRPTSTVPTTTAIQPPVPVLPVAWAPCDNGLQCGTVTVPIDYADPSGGFLHIAVARRPASDPAHRIGSIVINPGGPGGSGIDDLPTELRVVTAGLLARFDIVSFDPRGVGRSAPVSCEQGPTGTDKANVPAQLPDPTPTDSTTAKTLLDNDTTYSAACQKATGKLLDFVGTTDTAMDLDRIRAALGDAQLTYIGHSYGTLLGETYADLYPTHIRAMVLDSVIDPSISMVQMVSDQAVGFEDVLDDFFSWCTGTPGCAWHPTGPPEAALLALIAASRAHMLPGYGGRGAGPGEFYDALLDALYARSSWPTLANALAAAQAGNGAPVLTLSDLYTTHGSTNLSDANTAITCLDHPSPSDPSLYPSLSAAAAARAPVFGPLLTWGILGCGVWPVPATRLPHTISAPGSPPILVVGTTKDSATPYQWAVHVSQMLQNAVLLTRQGEDHVAYFYSACVRSYVEAYLVAGMTPPTGTVCPS
jgi:pimeloyl-ACP methyl ester carboxylesterase